MKPWLEWVFAGILLGLLLIMTATSCLTPSGGVSRPATLSEASESMFRLRCQCGGIAWVRIEVEPRLRVTVTSRGAPLGIEVKLDKNGVVPLRCQCLWIHFLIIRVDEDGIMAGIIHSQPPATPSRPKKPPVTA